MSATYAQPSRRQSPSFPVELLKEMFRSTPLGLVITALRTGR
ncbi:hypothetical protein ACPWT1_18985 [Ramlibacter sp. MMS24-I3-19]